MRLNKFEKDRLALIWCLLNSATELLDFEIVSLPEIIDIMNAIENKITDKRCLKLWHNRKAIDEIYKILREIE